ncbi:MAG: hypothetical protein ACREP9_00175 [Candidatus Dormibacteraceae bacterium]
MVRTMTYHDLTAEQRSKGAQKERERLVWLLNSPLLTPVQAQEVHAKLAHLDQWERLQLGTPPVPPPPAREVQHHVVSMSETVQVTEQVS